MEEHLTMLDQKFTFWFTYFTKKKNKQLYEFTDNMKHIGDFETGEDFWNMYQHMRRPSQLLRGTQFFLFKTGIKPMWEDKQNIGGGRYQMSFKKNLICDKVWEDLQIAFIISKKEFESINGIVMNIRTAEVFISIWTKDLNAAQSLKVSNWIKRALELPNLKCLEYKKFPN